MAHLAGVSAYARLSDRLNRFPQGAPPSELLFAILSCCQRKGGRPGGAASIRPFTVADAARAWKMKSAAARAILDGLADRAILVDMPQNGTQFYCLPPPMAASLSFP